MHTHNTGQTKPQCDQPNLAAIHEQSMLSNKQPTREWLQEQGPAHVPPSMTADIKNKLDVLDALSPALDDVHKVIDIVVLC